MDGWIGDINTPGSRPNILLFPRLKVFKHIKPANLLVLRVRNCERVGQGIPLSVSLFSVYLSYHDNALQTKLWNVILLQMPLSRSDFKKMKNHLNLICFGTNIALLFKSPLVTRRIFLRF